MNLLIVKNLAEKKNLHLKDNCLETYDMEYGGRNRRYYKITEQGRRQLLLYGQEWKSYSGKISKLFEEVI